MPLTPLDKIIIKIQNIMIEHIKTNNLALITTIKPLNNGILAELNDPTKHIQNIIMWAAPDPHNTNGIYLAGTQIAHPKLTFNPENFTDPLFFNKIQKIIETLAPIERHKISTN